MSAMMDAIAAHKAAWQAFQEAPEGKLAEQAEDEEGYALDALLTLLPENRYDVMALKRHLDWFVVEERGRFHEGTPEPTNVSNWPFATHRIIEILLGEPS